MNILRKTKDILRYVFTRMWNRQFLVFLFFLALSTSFWLFQALDETYEEDFSLPVELRNIPRDVVIASDVPKAVQIVLRDKGTTLLNYMYGDKLPAVVIDYEVYANPSGHIRILAAEILRQIRPKLASGTQVVSIRPDTLELYYNNGSSKRVPVRMEGQISAPVSAKLKLKAVRGAKFVPDEVSFSLGVDRLVEKRLTVPVVGVNCPDGVQLRTFPSQVEVIFQVSMSLYRRIHPDDFSVVVDYKELQANDSTKCRLRVAESPAGASHVRLSTEEVEYVIENLSSSAH